MTTRTGQKRTTKKGANATPAAPKRARRVDWKPAFIANLVRTGNVTEACRASKKARSWVYEQREVDAQFKKEWDEAMDQAADALEKEARRRAVQGTLKPVFYKGDECGTIREYSDTLLIFLLKGARPEKYRETFKHEHSGPGGAPIPLSIEDRINQVYGDPAGGDGGGGDGTATDASDNRE